MSNQKKPANIAKKIVIIGIPLLVIVLLLVKCQLARDDMGKKNLDEKKTEGVAKKPHALPHALVEFHRKQDNTKDVLREIDIYPNKIACTIAAFDAMDKIDTTNEAIQNIFLKFRYVCDPK